MTPTWHTGHKAASTPFLATQPIAYRPCARCSSRVLDVALGALARCCPRCREHAVSPRHRRAFERIVPRCRADAVQPPPATARPSSLASHRRARSVLTSARRFWLKMSIYCNPHPHRENAAASLAPLVGSEARILPVSRPIVTRMARESPPSCPSSHLPSPEIDIFSQNRAPQDTNRCSSVQTGAGSTQMEPRAQRTGIPARHTGGKPIPARNPLSSASCRA